MTGLIGGRTGVSRGGSIFGIGVTTVPPPMPPGLFLFRDFTKWMLGGDFVASYCKVICGAAKTVAEVQPDISRANMCLKVEGMRTCNG